MAMEVLSIPEHRLMDVIRVIEAGLLAIDDKNTKYVSKEARKYLTRWCKEEREYLGDMDK